MSLTMIVKLVAFEKTELEPMVSESRREGFRFLTRLCDEWANGTNRFSREGEALFGLFVNGALIGVGGINRQDALTGRLRRFYILPAHRRQGWGGQLLRHILGHAAAHFGS